MSIQLIFVSAVAPVTCLDCRKNFSFRTTGLALANEPNATQVARESLLEKLQSWQVACPHCGILHPKEARRRLLIGLTIWLVAILCVTCLLVLSILVDLPAWNMRGNIYAFLGIFGLF